MEPCVSVVVPTYNRQELLLRALGSVFAQEWDDYEVIVVDDASTDGTEQILEGLRHRVRVIRHRENRGGSAARNTGIDASRGEYVAFLDSDDVWRKEKLRVQVRKLRQASCKVALVYGRVEICTPEGAYLGSVPRHRGDIFETLLFGDVLPPTSAVMVKKECIMGVGGFDEQLPSRQDYDLWLRLARRWEIEYVRDTVATIHWEHTERIGHSPAEQKIEAAQRLIGKIREYTRGHPEPLINRVVSAQYTYLGKRLVTHGFRQEGLRYLLRALKGWPLNVRAVVWYLLGHCGEPVIELLRLVKRRSQRAWQGERG